jgi:hypothetical protein
MKDYYITYKRKGHSVSFKVKCEPSEINSHIEYMRRQLGFEDQKPKIKEIVGIDTIGKVL